MLKIRMFYFYLKPTTYYFININKNTMKIYYNNNFTQVFIIINNKNPILQTGNDTLTN